MYFRTEDRVEEIVVNGGRTREEGFAKKGIRKIWWNQKSNNGGHHSEILRAPMPSVRIRSSRIMPATRIAPEPDWASVRPRAFGYL
jgi:hypothetical protein